jgi:transposase
MKPSSKSEPKRIGSNRVELLLPTPSGIQSMAVRKAAAPFSKSQRKTKVTVASSHSAQNITKKVVPVAPKRSKASKPVKLFQLGTSVLCSAALPLQNATVAPEMKQIKKNRRMLPKTVEEAKLHKAKKQKEKEQKARQRRVAEAKRHEVQVYARAGLTCLQIAQHVKNFSLTSIRRWMKRIGAEQFHGYSARKSPGAPRKLETTHVETIKQFVLNKQFRSLRKLHAELGKAFSDLKISVSSLRRCLKDNFISWNRLRRSPLLSEKNKARRLAFAKKMLTEPVENIVFTDEKPFHLFPTPNPRFDGVWTEKGKKTTLRRVTVKHSPTFSVWGAISFHGPLCLVPYKNTIKAADYQKILDVALPSIALGLNRKEFILQQDGAPPHAAISTKTYLTSKGIRCLSGGRGKDAEWPAQSPDLNLIENVWALLDYRILMRQPGTMEQLENHVREEWSRISAKDVAVLYASWKRRLQAVINNNGGSTDY